MKIAKGKLLSIKKNKGLIFFNFSFYWINFESGEMEYITSFPVSQIKSFIYKNRMLTRLLRLEPRCIAQIKPNLFVLSFLHNIWLLDVNNKSLFKLIENRKGFSDPLNFCFDGQFLYWGEYGNNPDRGCVNIYRMNENLKIDLAYQFSEGTIRHIHNIIFDSHNSCYWILTGDNESASGIYRVALDWSTISAVKIGMQQFRAVVAFPINNGIIYATDSVDKENFIYRFSIDTGKIACLAPINGSCIYGTETKGYYIFSTTVEPSERRNIFSWWTNQLGNGIKSDEVYVIAVDKKSLETKVVRKFKKDRWPIRLFQYGTVTFPKGQEQEDNLWYYPIACKRVDGINIKMSLAEL